MSSPVQYAAELIANAKAIATPGKGILAADESTGTIGKRVRRRAPTLAPACRYLRAGAACSLPGHGGSCVHASAFAGVRMGCGQGDRW